MPNFKKKVKQTAILPLTVESVYHEYRDSLAGYIRKRVPVLEDAQDIMQNVFYQLSKVDLADAPIENISAWLYRVAANQITDRWRRKSVRGADKDGGTADYDPALVSDNSPEGTIFSIAVWERLQDALSELPRDQRVVFEMTELEGIPFREIAESTGVGMNTLLSRKRYAVLYLRERLKDLYDDIFD